MTYDEDADFLEKRKFINDLFDMLPPEAQDCSAWQALEIGGEGGILAGLMAGRVARLIGTDIVNPQAVYQGNYLALLRDKFARNGEVLPLDRLEFLMADAQLLPFRDGWFDFCFSQNAFEHIPDPEKALRELIRVTRKGGLIYLMFDPIWTADSGSHFLHRIGEPWLHLLDNDDAIGSRMAANGATPDEIQSYRHHMNRKPISYYREMFPRVIAEAGLKVHIRHEWSGCVDDSYPQHPNLPAAASALGIPTEDLLVRGLRFLLEV